MRRSYWLAIGLAASLAAGGSASPPASPPPPPRPNPWPNKLFLPDIANNRTQPAPPVVVYDFGEVPHGTICTHTFKITNIYDVPLQIMEVRTSSAALGFVATTGILQPNETGELTVTMNTSWFVGMRSEKFHVKIGPTPVDYAVIQVQARSNTDTKINPGAVYFGTVAEGTKTSREVKIEYRGRSRDWKIVEVLPVSGPFDVQVSETSRGGPLWGGAEYRVTVHLKPTAPTGPISDSLILKTNDPANPTMQLAVTGTVVAPLEIFPGRGRVRLDGVPIGQFDTKRIYVRAAKPFKIEEIRGTDDVISVEPPKDASLPCQVLIIKFKPTRPGVLTRQLRIRTDLDGGTSAVLTVEAEGVK